MEALGFIPFGTGSEKRRLSVEFLHEILTRKIAWAAGGKRGGRM
jgi:hypothetical protein